MLGSVFVYKEYVLRADLIVSCAAAAFLGMELVLGLAAGLQISTSKKSWSEISKGDWVQIFLSGTCETFTNKMFAKVFCNLIQANFVPGTQLGEKTEVHPIGPLLAWGLLLPTAPFGENCGRPLTVKSTAN